ncbi:MAG: AraC family transcriptional regulator [Bacteroidales bacterium]|nr:AraC family transcriptional regulator [Bacteroidales bacterium]
MSNNDSTKQDYLRRVNLVIDYIDKNLDKEITLSTLAEISSFSPFHLHRIVRAFLNEPIGVYITRQRVKKAASLIRSTDLSIQDIAFMIGYDMPSSLSKAFKQLYNISPTEYRTNKKIVIMNRNISTEDYELQEPKIVERPDSKVIYIQIIGQYGNEEYNGAWERICQFAGKNNLFWQKNEFLGIGHDDPSVTEASKCRYDACITIERDVKPEGEVGFKTIKGGKYAVFFHKGPYDKFQIIYNAIFRKWLPESPYQLRESPSFESYINDPCKVKPENLESLIYIPIQ